MNPQLFAFSSASPNDQGITPGRTRLEWLIRQLKCKLEIDGLAGTEAMPAVVWYMRFGFSMGVSRAELQAALIAMPALHSIAAKLPEEEITEGKPYPEFVEGQLVEVMAEPDGAAGRQGTVRGLCWHQKEGRWIFFVKENRKNMSKLYKGKDLRAARG